MNHLKVSHAGIQCIQVCVLVPKHVRRPGRSLHPEAVTPQRLALDPVPAGSPPRPPVGRTRGLGARASRPAEHVGKRPLSALRLDRPPPCDRGMLPGREDHITPLHIFGLFPPWAVENSAASNVCHLVLFELQFAVLLGADPRRALLGRAVTVWIVGDLLTLKGFFNVNNTLS